MHPLPAWHPWRDCGVLCGLSKELLWDEGLPLRYSVPGALLMEWMAWESFSVVVVGVVAQLGTSMEILVGKAMRLRGITSMRT